MNTPPANSGVTSLALPALYRHADLTSNQKQLAFVRATKARLGLLALVAIGGAIAYRLERVDVGGALSAVAFASVAFLEVYLWQARPERVWYRARALAESVKTLAWRYATKAEPFEGEDADERFLQRLRAVHGEVQGTVIPPDDANPDQITDTMRTVRNQDFERRRSTYLELRVGDQIVWYAAKARWNDARASGWSIALVLVNVAGLAFAILKAASVVSVDVLGIAGALAAIGIAWVQTRQYASLAAAYSTTHHELTIVRERIRAATEANWAREVSDAEEAISREHTMWQASRSGIGPIT